MKRLLCCLAIALVGCGGGRSPSEPATPDSISLVSASPADGTKLAPGSTVTFIGSVSYQLGSTSDGKIIEAIEDQDNHLLTTGAQTQVSIGRGSGTAQLSETASIPATGVITVRVFFLLVPAGQASTTKVAIATYPVG